jgi:Glycine/D-amino acid oxidases (deaminating)
VILTRWNGRPGFLPASTRDRLPGHGTLGPGRHVITGLGSRGLTYGPYLAYLLAARMLGLPSFAEWDVLKALDWTRFRARDAKKGLIA